VEELRDTLARLHDELSSIQEIDEDLRQELRQALDEISRKIEKHPGGQEQSPLGDRLEDLTLRFESTHPVVAEMMRELVRTLSQMGI
jgi:predicted RNase H-like nuclease (RuvC/YqgF family)